MNHLTELQFSMLVDGAFEESERVLFEEHIAACDQCRAQLDVYQDDQRLIQAAFAAEEVVTVPAPPKFKKPLGFREFAAANLMTGFVFWFAQFAWKTVAGEVVIDGFSWIASLVVPDFFDLGVSTFFYLTLEGTAMFEAYSEFIITGVIAIALTWLALTVKRSTAMSLSVLLCVLALGTPESAEAFQYHKDDLVIGSDETIDDTVLFTGESLAVDGDINGDLLAFGKRIVINGNVDGNLIVAAESISISGTVSGTVFNAAESIDLSKVIVGGDFWGAGQNVQLSPDSRIDGNAIMAGEITSMAGEVRRDLLSAANTFEVSGKVGEDVVSYVDKIKLLGEANIQGDLTIHSVDEDSLQQSSGASIGGDVKFEHRDLEGKPRNRYLTVEYYVGQLLRLVAAFLVAYGLFSLFPRMREVSLEGGAAGFVTAGLGLVALVSIPVIALILTITVVGIPLAAFSIFVWLTALYLAKILVAWMIGSMILDDAAEDPSVVAVLSVGLITVIVAVNLPFVGGIISLILTAVGFGMLIQWARADQRGS